MNAYRQAALCLHGLTADDRDWLLSNLPEHQQTALNQLLGELKELGVPADQDFSRQFLTGVIRNNADTARTVATIDAAPAEQIWALLANEPDSLIAVLCGLRPWSWRDGIQAKFRKTRHKPMPSSAIVAEKVSQALMEIMAERIDATAQRYRTTTKPRKWYARLGAILWQR